MKRTILLLIGLCFTFFLNAQVSKTVSITAGNLKATLTTEELSTVTKLTLTGTIDARDFKTMRDNMPLLAELDLSGVTVEAYTGAEGTAGTGNIDYPADHIPHYAFYNNIIWQGKTSLTSIILPTTVTSIEDIAFGYCSGLVSMTIPSSVISIGQFAFRNCSDLPIIIIPSSVTSIGWGAFYEYRGIITVDANNSNYSSIDGVLFNKDQTLLIKYPFSKTGNYIIPSSVTTIGNNAFYGCSGLTSITMPSSVISIEQFAFGGCSSLTSIIIPSSVTFIGTDAFWGCSGLTSITIPSSVITIESYAFNVCSGLITVDENNPNYSSIDGVLFNKNKSSLIHCPTSKTGNYSIPSSVTSITPYAFAGCSSLVSIIIPSSLTSIGDYTFSYCSALISVNIPSSINSIGNAAFYNCSGLSSIFSNSSIPVDLSLSVYVFQEINKITCTLNVPYGSKAAYQSANQWQDFTNIVEATNGFNLSVGTVSIAAAAGSTATVNVTANVSWTASSDQTWLTISPTSGTGNSTLTFTSEANPSIGTRKATVTVSATGFDNQIVTVTQDGSNAPLALTAGGLATALTPEELASVASLTLTGTIDARDFKTMRDDMPLLAQLDISAATIVAYNGPDGTSRWGNTTYNANEMPEFGLDQKSVLTSVLLPSSITTINAYALGRMGLTSISIPSSVISINNYAFQGCQNMTTISIPASVTSIGFMAFIYNTGLITVDAANPNYSSLDGVLYNKNQTTLIEFPMSKTGAFIIPSSVTTIGPQAFTNCYQLISILIPASVTTINKYAFESCNNLSSITVGWPVPLDLSSYWGIFNNVNKTACILHVPYGTASRYRAANQWKDFSNIVEATNGFNLSVGTVSVAAAAGSTATVNVTANVSWTASSDQTWLTVNPSSGTNNSTLTFTAEANPSRSMRSAKVTVSATGVDSQTITVTQVGSNVPLNVTAGGLSTSLTAEELASVAKLTLTGTIDARDFKTMRDNMPLLAELDLSGTTIVAYSGSEGTSIWNNNNYSANTVPEFAFMNSNWQGKNSLISVVFPSTMTSFGQFAIGNCNGLTIVTIPSLVTTIGNAAFSGCQSLTSVSIPPSVTTIEMQSFLACRSLTSVFIPSSVTSIGNRAFSCSSGSITIEASNPNYSSIDGVLYNKTQTSILQCPISKTGTYSIPVSVTTIGANAFEQCSNLTSIVIPSSVTSIERSSFQDCSGLTTITIPSSVTSIGNAAFYNCRNLSSIYSNSGIPVDLSSSGQVFDYIDKTTCTLNVPYASKAAYQAANQWQDFTNIVEATNGFNLSAVTSNIGTGAGSTATVDITANVTWTASSDQSWLTVNPTSGSGNQTFTFTAEAIPLAITSRVASVTISADGVPTRTITVTQEVIVNPNCKDIGLVGSFNQWGSSSSDVPLIQGVNNSCEWSLDFAFSGSEQVKFRQNNNWNVNWGNSNFPNGIAISYGPNIPVSKGNYHIRFNSDTGEYSFETFNIVCNPQDSLALVAVYDAMNGNNWNRRQGWKTDRVQYWQGVTLNPEGRVTKLNLTANNLRGTIPTEIGNLTVLRQLSLGNGMYVDNWNGYNDFNGKQLPTSLSNLVNLEILSLDQLQFHTELPDIFSGLVNLRELYLNENYFTNAQLPAGILNCSKLERLFFPYNNFSQLPNLTGLANIQEIQAYMNRLTFEDIEPNASISGFNYSGQAEIGQPLGLNPDPGSTVSQTIEVGGEHNQYQWYKNDLPVWTTGAVIKSFERLINREFLLVKRD